MNRISVIASLAMLAVIMTWPGEFAIAWAHAFPNEEQPLVGSTITTPPSKVSITYDAPIESLFAKLQVIDGAGQEQITGPPSVGPDHRTLSVELKPLKPGHYTVRWSVVSEDGHRTEGSYDFIVSRSKP